METSYRALGILYLDDLLHLEGLAGQLHDVITDGRLLVGLAGCALHVDISLGVPANQNVASVVHLDLDTLQ